MFRKKGSEKYFAGLYGNQPSVGDQVSYANIVIEAKKIEGDVIHWEEVPVSEYKA